jgi:hypothetical protein
VQKVNLFSPWTMLQGALKEGLRALRKQQPSGPEIKLRKIASYSK